MFKLVTHYVLSVQKNLSIHKLGKNKLAIVWQ